MTRPSSTSRSTGGGADIPFDIQDVNLDTDPIPAPTRLARQHGRAPRRREAREDRRLHGVIAQAGRRGHRRVEAFALQNAYESTTARAWQGGRLLNAGASAITSTSCRAISRSSPRISMGGNAYTEAVQKELDLPFESAEQLKKGIPVDGATFEEAQPVLRAITENVLLEIQKTFDFFKATASSEQIDRIVLSGGASRVDGFREMLQERFSAPVEDFDPFRTVTWDHKKMGSDPAELAPTAAVAVGLALRRVTDR